MPTTNVHSFHLPSRPLPLALGHKHNAWYLLFAHPHPTAPSRQIARLSLPRASGPRNAEPYYSPRPRFWFSPRARSGWEHPARPGGETLLDLLMELELHEPPLFAVVDWDGVGNAKGGGAGGEGGHGPVAKVEVLIPEHELAHYCEGCARWEVAGGDALRWFMVRSDALPRYLCPSCHAKDWFGAKLLRCLKRIMHTLLLP